MGVVEGILYMIISAAVGFVAGVFVYRKNKKDIGPLADKVDKLHDRLEELKDKL